MAKQTFIVKCKWTCYGETRIEAETAEEAYTAFKEADAIPDLENETGREDLAVLEVIPASDPMEDGTEGQDRQNYTDDQDRENYTSEEN